MGSRTRMQFVGFTTAALLIASTAGAAIFTVSKTTDTADGTCDGDCSLREAVIAANASGVDDTVVLPAGVYSLTRTGVAGVDDEDASVGDIEIDTQAGGGLTIQGAGSATTTIDAAALSHRIFHMPVSFNAVAVSISGVTLSGGNLTGFPSSSPGCALRVASRFVTSVTLTDVVATNCTGGQVAIYSHASLVMNQCSIHDNASGGIGLSTEPSTSGSNKTSNITNTTIARNDGIGISAIRSTTKVHSFNLTNVTLSDNNQGIPLVSTIGAITTTTIATLKNVTIANDHGRGISAMSDFFGAANVQVQNTILWGNARGDVLGIGQDDAAVLPVSLGNNVVGDGGSGVFTQPSDRTNTNPMLAALGDYGGPTETHDLQFGSPAIDKAAAAACPATDQRGIARPLDGDGNGIPVCDIGAVEFTPPACSNGLDDDGDAFTDFPGDRGCTSAADDSERASPESGLACDDGIDNDGDQLADHPADPGCPFSWAELEDPQCDDGIDNDQNGFTDFADSKCQADWPYWEKTPSCGLGAELVLVLPLLAVWRRRRVRV